MEFTHLNQENLVNITFNDMMQVVISEETTPNQKMAYIYLLNVIMDMDEKITDIKNKINEYENGKKYED